MPEENEGQQTRIYLKSKRAPIVVAGEVDEVATAINQGRGPSANPTLIGFENAGHTFEGRVYVDPADVVGLRSAQRREVESPEPAEYFGEDVHGMGAAYTPPAARGVGEDAPPLLG